MKFPTDPGLLSILPVDDTPHVILAQALINSGQVNIVAVLRPPVPLRHLIIESGCQITRHEAIHAEMIYRR